MPKRKQEQSYYHHQQTHTQACHVAGCAAEATFKAPRSPQALDDYVWLCLDHIREHNQKWDYFAGMDSNEIEDFIKDAVTGHRPTWKRESHISRQYDKLQEALYQFLHNKKPEPTMPQVSSKIRAALATMEMQYPFTSEQLKGRYRELVKKYHPDVNHGNAQAEAMFKKVTAAHLVLVEHLRENA